MGTRIVLLCCVVWAGCGEGATQHVSRAETQAAETALASLKLRRDGLRQGSETLRVKVANARRMLEEARVVSTGLQAALALAEAEADPSHKAALEAWQLEHAGPDERATIATRIIARNAPCDAPQGCAVPPPALCDDGTSARPVRPEWTCEPNGDRVLCTARVTLPASSTWAASGRRTLQSFVRVVRVVDGKLAAADWPPPDPELYAPNDDEERLRCEREQASWQCRADCLAQRGVQVSMCALTTGNTEAQEACAVHCAGKTGPPSPGRVEVTSRITRQPLPGVFVMELDETFLDGEGAPVGTRTLTRLLEDPWGSDPVTVEEGESLTSLTLVAEAEDARGKAMPGQDVKLPDSGVPRGAGWLKEMLVIPGAKGLTGYTFDGKLGVVTSTEVCRRRAEFPAEWKDAWTILCNAGGAR